MVTISSPQRSSADQLSGAVTYFHFYCDETGLEATDDTKVVRLVGLLAPQGLWPIFHRSWTDALTSPPSIRFWHTAGARDISVARTPAEGIQELTMTGAEIEAKATALAAVIRRHHEAMVALNIEMPMDVYRAALAQAVNPRAVLARRFGTRAEKIRSPVYVAMYVAIHEALAIAAEWNHVLRPNEPMQLWSVFERDRSRWEQEFDLTETMLLVRETAHEALRESIGPIIFVQGKGPLAYTTVQAADLFAYHLARDRDSGSPSDLWRLQFDAVRLHNVVVPMKVATAVIEGRAGALMAEPPQEILVGEAHEKGK